MIPENLRDFCKKFNLGGFYKNYYKEVDNWLKTNLKANEHAVHFAQFLSGDTGKKVDIEALLDKEYKSCTEI